MAPTQELIDDIYRRRILRARAMSPGEKMLSGANLFEMGCEITRAGIRAQHPGADEAEVERILRDRLALSRRLEEIR